MGKIDWKKIMKRLGLKEAKGSYLGFKKKKFLVFLMSVPIPFIFAFIGFLFREPTTTIIALFSLGWVFAFFPLVLFTYLEFKDVQLAEDQYPNFLRDLEQSVAAGMTFPQAIETVSETDYGALTKYIKKLRVWLSWNMAFPSAWKKFTKSLEKSNLIKRVNGIVLESFYSGGDIKSTLDSLADSVNLLKELEADKKSLMRQQVIVMYIIYFIFLGIIISLYQILIPMLYVQRLGLFSGIGVKLGEAPRLDVDYFKNLFFVMTIVQSFSIGLISGQISEEKIVAGVKHIMTMVAIGVFVFFIFIFPSFLTVNVNVFPEKPNIGEEIFVDGSVLFSSVPAEGAIIELVSPTKEVSTQLADNVGEFHTTFTAPTQPGPYEIVVSAKYEGELKTVVKTILVQ